MTDSITFAKQGGNEISFHYVLVHVLGLVSKSAIATAQDDVDELRWVPTWQLTQGNSGLELVNDVDCVTKRALHVLATELQIENPQ